MCVWIIQNHLNWSVSNKSWQLQHPKAPWNLPSPEIARYLGRDSKTCNESMRTNENQWEPMRINRNTGQTTRQLKPLGLGIWRCRNICFWKQRCDVKTWRETSVWRVTDVSPDVCRLTYLDTSLVVVSSCRNCASHDVAPSAALAQRPEPGRRVPCFEDHGGKNNFDNKAT